MTHRRTYGHRLSGLALAVAAIPAMLPAERVEAQAKQPTAKTACSITYASAGDLTEVLKDGGFKFTGYDKLCRRLAADNMSVDFTHSSGVLQGRSYAWVTVRLARKSNNVLSTIAHSFTTISEVADTPQAKRILWDSANSALEWVASDPDSYFASVATEETRLRLALATPAKAPFAR